MPNDEPLSYAHHLQRKYEEFYNPLDELKENNNNMYKHPLIDNSPVDVEFVQESWGEFKFENGYLDGKVKSLPCDKSEHTELVYGDEVDSKGHKVNVLKFFYVKENEVFVLKNIKAIQRVY